MNYIQAAESFLGKTVQARNGATYELLEATWDDTNGPIPAQADLDAVLVTINVDRLRKQRVSEVGKELARRSMLVHGKEMSIDRMHRKNAQFAFKKAKGTLSGSDEVKADLLDALGDSADSLYDTIEEADQAALEDLTVADDGHWI